MPQSGRLILIASIDIADIPGKAMKTFALTNSVVALLLGTSSKFGSGKIWLDANKTKSPAL